MVLRPAWVFDITHFNDFLDRAPALILERPEITHQFDGLQLEILIDVRGMDREISSLTQICNKFLTLLTSMDSELLDFHQVFGWPERDVSQGACFGLFRHFRVPAVMMLGIGDETWPAVLSGLNKFAMEMVTVVFLILHDLYVERGSFDSRDIKKFNTARQLSNHPVTFHEWSSESPRHSVSVWHGLRTNTCLFYMLSFDALNPLSLFYPIRNASC